ncbi:phytanoyl-CoA dioxygenase, partial [Trypanosoma cruzi]
MEMHATTHVAACSLRRLRSSAVTSRVMTSTHLSLPYRLKSYVLKFLRGQLPEDLKDLNGALGCLYGTLPDVDEFGQFVIAPEIVERFHQLGYIKLPRPVLDAQQVDKLADEVNELANNVEHHPKTEKLYATSLANLTEGPLFYCQGQWRAAWGMHDLIYLPTITVAASQILGNSIVRLWYDEVFMKEARKGPCVPWQQNYARWQHTTPVNHVTVMIALDT